MQSRAPKLLSSLLALLAAASLPWAAEPATLTVRVTRQGLPLEDPSRGRVTVFRPGDRDDPVVWTVDGRPVRFRAGTYDLVVRYVNGPVEAEHVFPGVALEGTVEREVDFDIALATLTVQVARGGEPVPGYLAKIAVYRAGRHEVPIAETRPGTPLTLRPGLYDVEAVLRGGDGLTRRWAEGVAVEGDRVETVEFGAVQARVTLTLVRGGAPFERPDAGWRLYRPGTREEAVAEAPTGDTVSVPAGAYDVGLFWREDGAVAERWLAGVELRGDVRRAFDVAGGEERVTVRVLRHGRPLAGAWCRAYPASADPGAEHGSPLATVAGGATIELAPGAYDFLCRLRRDGLAAETRATANVEAGATIDVELDYEAATLRVLPPRSGSPEPGAIRLLAIVDSSKDMAGALGERTRLEAVRVALGEAIDALRGTGVHVGVRVFGVAPDEQADCDDSALLVPVEPLDPRAIARSLRYLRPAGRASVAASLDRAATDLPETGRNTVVLLVAGRDGCGGDPCRAASELVLSGAAARVHVLDLAPGSGPGPLACAGTYFAVRSDLALRERLREVIREVRRPGAGSVVVLAPGGREILTGASLGERIELVRGTYDVVVHAGGESWTWSAVAVAGDLELVAGPR